MHVHTALALDVAYGFLYVLPCGLLRQYRAYEYLKLGLAWPPVEEAESLPKLLVYQVKIRYYTNTLTIVV
jgi:hypothetical protein